MNCPNTSLRCYRVPECATPSRCRRRQAEAETAPSVLDVVADIASVLSSDSSDSSSSSSSDSSGGDAGGSSE